MAELTPNRDSFFITYTLSEGERYRFGKIDVTTRFDKLDVMLAVFIHFALIVESLR